ncbi:MAG: phosphoribosylformylglycinamidine synthase I [Anaerolineaceae bacterium]|nr:phosphoribosylformylglycinamidine synthase I [Anaerolineaceae bacterium]
MKPKALILFTTGTNRDGDVAVAFEQAGAQTKIRPLIDLRTSEQNWQDYQILVIPGGFSYADALGAGKLLALDLNSYFKDQIQDFVSAGKPVIGICNGFQALVKAGILPGNNLSAGKPQATLTFNQIGHFECRWVQLRPSSQTCLWTRDLKSDINCPVAHGEGNFQVADDQILDKLQQSDQIALTYLNQNGQLANGEYPYNPNGSCLDIAGICNPSGNVLGLMPHPEDHIFEFQNPNRLHRKNNSGLALFVNGVSHATQS